MNFKGKDLLCRQIMLMATVGCHVPYAPDTIQMGQADVRDVLMTDIILTRVRYIIAVGRRGWLIVDSATHFPARDLVR